MGHRSREANRRFEFAVHMTPIDHESSGPTGIPVEYLVENDHFIGQKTPVYDQWLHLERQFLEYEKTLRKPYNERALKILGMYLESCQHIMKLAAEKRDDITEDVVPAYQRASQLEWNLKVKLGLV